jgi:hypothetical protein
MPCSKQEWRIVGAVMGFVALYWELLYLSLHEFFIATESVIKEPEYSLSPAQNLDIWHGFEIAPLVSLRLNCSPGFSLKTSWLAQ